MSDSLPTRSGSAGFLTACYGKEAFESRTLASRVARRRTLGHRGRNRRTQIAYKCSSCGKYHIGNRP